MSTMRALWLTSAACVVTMVAAPAPALACSCTISGPPCQATWQATDVFAAEVLDVETETMERDGFTFPIRRRVRLRVESSWHGEASGEVALVTGGGGGDCGYEFVEGRRYLVYAQRAGDRLTTNSCTRTRPLDDAQEDLTYLESLTSAARRGQVVGRVRRSLSSERMETEPVPGYTVRVRHDAGLSQVTTDAAGRYEVTGVPVGPVRVEVDLPAGEHARSQSSELHDERGCAAVDFTVIPGAAMTVRMVNEAGQPAPRVRVDLVRRGSVDARYRDHTMVIADDDGLAEFVPVRPGRYVLGVNLAVGPDERAPYPEWFYPGVRDISRAHVFDVVAGRDIDLAAFPLPARLVERRRDGLVRGPDGAPVPGVQMLLQPLRAGDFPYGSARQVIADHEGRFRLRMFDGVRYRLTVTPRHPAPPIDWQSAPIEIVATEDASMIEVRVTARRAAGSR